MCANTINNILRQTHSAESFIISLSSVMSMAFGVLIDKYIYDHNLQKKIL